MSVLTGKALHDQLSGIMAALTKAAVAEICVLVDEGIAALQMEITRSHKENQTLKKRLQLIESIVIRGSNDGNGAELVAASEDQRDAETPQQQQRDDGGAEAGAAAAGRDNGAAVEELPDVVLIKDEDSDNDAYEESHMTVVDGGATAAREAVSPPPLTQSMNRHWPGNEDEEKSLSSELPQKSPTVPVGMARGVSIYTLDSPRSKPSCSTQLEMDGGDSVCSYASLMDSDVQLVHEDGSLLPAMSSASRPPYFANSMMESQSSTSGAELDLNLTWSKDGKSHMTFAQFQQIENMDGDAFGLKLISVSGSAPTDGQQAESSSSAFDYEKNFGVYRDQSGPSRRWYGVRKRRRFVCSVCNKTFATSQNLDVHMRIHTGERPFSCNQCGKTFTQSAHLKSHLSIHSGERPYACTLCSRSFIVGYSLKLHMKKCHPNV